MRCTAHLSHSAVSHKYLFINMPCKKLQGGQICKL